MRWRMHIDPGELNRCIEILEQDPALDAGGYPTGAWRTALSCWASFHRTSSSEIEKNGADFSRDRARFLVRTPRQKIDRKMRVRYGGRIWQIEYVNDYGDRKQYTEIAALLSETEA